MTVLTSAVLLDLRYATTKPVEKLETGAPYYADCPGWCRVEEFHYHNSEGELKWG